LGPGLKNENAAIILAQRLKFLTKDPTRLWDLSLKMPIIDKHVGDKIQVTMARALSTNSSGYESEICEITEKAISFMPLENRIQAMDLKDFGANIGIWSSDATENWSSATTTMKAMSGFWSDASGYVDTAATASTTLNIDLWW